jgi:putative lipoic acid-binding regulatory protein
LVAACGSDDEPEPNALSPAAERLVRFTFVDLGASQPEIKCGVETFVQRVGVDELNQAAAEFQDGNTGRYMSHRLDIAAVSDQCGVEDHRQVDCDDPKGAEQRMLCEDFEEITSGGGSDLPEG